MSQQVPISEPLWDTVPADARASLLDAWGSLQDRIAALEATVRDLQARLKLNSTNSCRPPSSDPIGLKRKPPLPPPGGGAAGSAAIARRSAPWSLPRSSARLPTADPIPVGGVARRCGVPTPPH